MKTARLLSILVNTATGFLIVFKTQALPVPPSLEGIPVPLVAGLESGPNPIIRDIQAARQLGKALFWDMSVGSDGVACATCHFHAGADRRHQNQLDSGTKHQGATSAQTFDPLPSGRPGGPNTVLTKQDFPLFRLENPVDKNSRVIFTTDDVVSSSGVFLGDYRGKADSETGSGACYPKPDALFHVGTANSRRVSVRNAPTVFNAGYNFRNFWDGRANNVFNGVSAYGPRDSEAGVWIVKNQKALFGPLHLKNASLASQAVAPPLDDREMSCQGRRFIDLARKLLPQKPLEKQHISETDSLLGNLRDPSGTGLQGDYRGLIQQAFDPRFWSKDAALEGAGDPSTRQIEANFAFFFGLAIQSYENTLISDKTRFDGARNLKGEPSALTEAERRGLKIFSTECMLCHQGPTFSAAAHPAVYSNKGARERLVDRREINGDFDGAGLAVALIDIGFSNTSVTPTDYDLGLGGTDPYGNPLSFSEQFFLTLKDPKRKMIDPVDVSVCDFQRPFHMDFQPHELVVQKDVACGKINALDGCHRPQCSQKKSRNLSADVF